MDNYIKDAFGGTWAQAPLCERHNASEATLEYSLPDYQPEIKRLLRVQATVLPPDSYVGAGNAELSGKINYHVLYAANDGALYAIMTSDEYRFSIPVEMPSEFDASKGLFCQAEVTSEAVGGRVIAPRRLALKCRLQLNARILAMKQLGVAPSREEQTCGAERLFGSLPCACVYTEQAEPMALEDEILWEGGDDLRVISAEGQVFVSEATAGSSCVNCRGEVCLKLLLCREGSNEPPALTVRRIPFLQSVPMEEARVDCEACAHGVCSEIGLTVEEGRILVALSVLLSVRAQRNEILTFTRDLYSTTRQTKTSYLTHTLPVAGRCFNGHFSINTAIPLAETGIRREDRIVDAAMVPVQISTEYQKGRLILLGKCRCHAVLAGGEDYSACELEVPFRYEADLSGEPLPGVPVCDLTVDVISCRGRMDSERIGLDAELAVCLAMQGEVQGEVLSEVQFGEEILQTGAICRVCYPSREDTLWSVAKRYHQPIRLIASRNGLPDAPAADTPASLSGALYLLV